jgi:hypothetical protein
MEQHEITINEELMMALIRWTERLWDNMSSENWIEEYFMYEGESPVTATMYVKTEEDNIRIRSSTRTKSNLYFWPNLAPVFNAFLESPF